MGHPLSLTQEPCLLERKQGFAVALKVWDDRAVDGIEVIETEWGSELHKRLVAEKHAARVAYRNSPEAWEEARRMKEAGPLQWGRIIFPDKRKKTPIYKW
jgi:hypothetical protein